MKSSANYTLLVSLVFSGAVFSGCHCGPPVVQKSQAELSATPTALNFNACPTLDENGQPVQDVFPDEQTFTLSNLGKVDGPIAGYDVSGDDPNIKSIFTIPDDKKPTSIAGSESVDIPVHFSPKAKGDVRGTLTISSSADGVKPVTVALIGTGINLPSQPTNEVSFEDAPGSGNFSACDPTVISTCSPTFPDTFFNQTTTLTFRITNKGCPTLKITDIEIQKNQAQTAQQQAYSFESGFVPPTAATPVTLNAADNPKMDFKISFSPVDETTNPSTPDDGQRYSILVVKTNDPANPEIDISLGGVGVKPSPYLSPTFCNFSDVNDTCGEPTRTPGKALIRIGNGGTRSITVSNVAFANGGRSGRFTLTGNPAQGQTIAPGAFITQEVSYTDQPVFVSDDLVVSTTDSQNTSQSAGDVRATFYGGTQPCLSTNPSDTMYFDADGGTSQTVTIENGSGCGLLIVDDVTIDQPNTFFTVATKPPPGTPVTAGQSTTATVTFKPPISGGTQTAVLRVQTNDPVYGPTPYKVITLYSQEPLDQLPIAVIRGCMPGQTPPCNSVSQMSVSKAAIQAIGGKKYIEVDGTQSYDPQNNGTNLPATKFQFTLTSKPTGANAAALDNNGVQTTTGTSNLTIDDTVVGEYRIALKVYDSAGQPSANIDLLKINVTQ